ncbi:MAG: L-serine ammonia-lyase, iron-sulfur-dependent, subunit alpha, partial [Clostridia bacterium]|nr:L-serine ammonia-lyase, iron-sulfur-dependent, subunit alpha [Clostridia bacterium]
TKENRIVCAYAFAVSEQNADNGTIVTAPTCGSCGVLPSVLKYMQEKKNFSDKNILKALAVGGLIGNLVKTNASISGAECGCQAEIGTACSMAAAALAELFGMGIDQIEYAAEVALEHHLGLTCDPVLGLVQIPCIERNAVAAMRAINALSLANFLANTRKVSFDTIVETMYQTGIDISHLYRETSEGGLAKLYKHS